MYHMYHIIQCMNVQLIEDDMIRVKTRRSCMTVFRYCKLLRWTPLRQRVIYKRREDF